MYSALEIAEAFPSGNLLGVGDGFPNTSLVLLEHGYNLNFNPRLLENTMLQNGRCSVELKAAFLQHLS